MLNDFVQHTLCCRWQVEIDIILTEEEHSSFLRTMAAEGYSCIDKAFGSIKSEDATASREADLKAIRALVESKPGGFHTLNSTVKQHLERWFESIGAVRTAQRLTKGDTTRPAGYLTSTELARIDARVEVSETSREPATTSRGNPTLDATLNAEAFDDTVEFCDIIGAAEVATSKSPTPPPVAIVAHAPTQMTSRNNNSRWASPAQVGMHLPWRL